MQDSKQVVLIIDDDPDFLASTRMVLEGNGYSVVSAASAEEGLEVHKQASPDAILVDLMMEEIDAGTRFIKSLKAAGVKAPVFMLSSVGDSLAESINYSELGLAGVFQKPIDSNMLLKTLKAKLKA